MPLLVVDVKALGFCCFNNQNRSNEIVVEALAFSLMCKHQVRLCFYCCEAMGCFFSLVPALMLHPIGNPKLLISLRNLRKVLLYQANTGSGTGRLCSVGRVCKLLRSGTDCKRTNSTAWSLKKQSNKRFLFTFCESNRRHLPAKFVDVGCLATRALERCLLNRQAKL